MPLGVQLIGCQMCKFVGAGLLIFISLFIAHHANATDVLQELRAKNYQQIEDSIRNSEARLLAGDLGEYDALELLKPLYQHEDVLTAELNDWTSRRPRSYVAYLARGTYRRKLGENRRGEDYVQQIPPANLLFMQQQFELAKKDLRKAQQLSPRSYLATLNLMNIAMYEDDDGAARTLLRAANELYKNNLLVRARYLVHLQPRWGGSFARMDAFIEESRSSGVSQQVVNLLSAIKLEDWGFTREKAHDLAAAKASYLKSLSLARGADKRFINNYLSHAEYWCSQNCR